MLRTVVIAGIVVILLAGVGGAMLYLAYAPFGDPPEQVLVSGLAASSTVTAYRDGAVSIRASNREDAYAALGYAHAQLHGWSMTLWQRTARGQLSSWFGDALLPLDRLTRQLALARLARAAYEDLPETDRNALQAYSEGVNAAFTAGEAHRAGEFSVLEAEADRWEAWYPVAVERLFAWLAAEPPSEDSLRNAPSALRTFFESDRLLRGWLHIHGFDQSMAWTEADSAGTRLTQRHVYGASALPIFQEVEIIVDGEAPLSGASLIGTPYMPAGRSASRAWAVMLSGTARLAATERDTSRSTFVYERIETAEGEEHLVRIRQDPGDIFFEADTPLREEAPMNAQAGVDVRTDSLSMAGIPADSIAGSASQSPFTGSVSSDSLPAASPPSTRPSTDQLPNLVQGWTLEWQGLEAGTDATSWLALAGEGSPTFRLIDGDGLVVERGGGVRVLGTPLFRTDYPGGTAVGNSSWIRYAAQQLDSLGTGGVRGDLAPEALTDVHSVWAAEVAPGLTEAAIAVPEQSALVIDALAYLRNWDFGFDRASIAASIFDTWAGAYLDSLGRLPEATLPDTALGLNLVRYELLVEAVGELAGDFGEDLSQWRWEQVQPHRYYFPVWSADSAFVADVAPPSKNRYAPITLPGIGHVTTLYHGPSAVHRGLDAPATWTGWVSTNTWDTFHYRARRFQANRFFGRYLVSDRIPDPVPLPASDQPSFTTTLLPEQ